jgi:hypothetical protein
LSDGDEPERFIGATITWNTFPMLGIQPILGRQIRDDEDTPGGPRVVLLSHGVAAALRGRSIDPRPLHHCQRQSPHRDRRHAAEVPLSGAGAPLDSNGADRARQPAGVFAKRLWPNRNDVIGRRFRLLDDKQNQWITIIGMVSDFRLFSVRDGKPSPYAFVSYPYDPARNTGLTIRVAGGDPTSITTAVWQYGLFGWMFSIFGAVALLLASIGVYGVLSYAVSQRTQEIGVRMALGASRQNVFALIVSHGLKLAGVGILCGVIGAAAVTRVVASLLYTSARPIR